MMQTCEELTREVLRRSRVRRAKQRRRHAIAGAALCALLIGGVWAAAGGVRPTVQPAESEPVQPPEDEADRSAPVRYSAVARGGPQHPADAAGTDHVAFSEKYCLREMTAMVEGEILSVTRRQRNYREVSAGKGELQCCIFTVAYTLRVERVFLGDLTVGQTLTFENEVDRMDAPQWLAAGGRYVLPLYMAGELLYPAQYPGVSGDLDRVSLYALLYPWHSQIEAAQGGYLVPTDWPALCTGEDVRPVIPDGDGDWYPEPVYVPAAAFDANVQTLLRSVPAESEN